MRRILPAGLATLAVVAAACGGGSSGSSGASGGADRDDRPTATAPPTTAAGGAPGVAAPTTGPVAVPAAFDFRAPALDGGTVRGADYAQTGVALWFWAPW